MTDNAEKMVKVCVNYGVQMPQTVRDVERQMVEAIEAIQREAQERMEPYVRHLSRIRNAYPEPFVMDVSARSLASLIPGSIIGETVGPKP